MEFTPKNAEQESYVKLIKEKPVIFCSGKAGVGKTSVAVAIGCQYMKEGKKLLITRPTVECGKGLGFLPGDLEDKFNPYLVPVLDELDKYLGENRYKDFMSPKIKLLEFGPIEFMRGRNFHNMFVIVDEAQNLTAKQIQMVVSRLGRHAKIVFCGDTNQTDIYNSGLQYIIDKLAINEHVGHISLLQTVRCKILESILEDMGDVS